MKKNSQLISPFPYVAAFSVQMINGIVGISVPINAFLLRASPFLIGLIGASGGITYSVMSLFFGILSDRFKRKTLIFISTVLYGFSSLLYFLLEEPFFFVMVRILEWMSVAMFWPSLEALIADTQGENIDESFKKFNISWGSAMTIGPLIGGALISLWTTKTPFLLSASISFTLSISTILLVKEKPRREKEHFSLAQSASTETTVIKQVSLFSVLSSIFLFSFIVGTLFSLFPAYATDLGIPAYEIGLLMLLFGTVRTIVFYYAKYIEMRLKKAGIFLTSSLIFAASSIFIVNSNTASMFSLCFAAFGFGAGASYATAISFMLQWGSSKGHAAGIFESSIGLGYFVGSLLGGALSELNSQAPYILCLLLSLAIFSIQAVLLRKNQ